MTIGKVIALTIQTFDDKVVSLLFNTLSRFAIGFLPWSRCLLISWLQSLDYINRMALSYLIFLVALLVKSLPAIQETWIRSLGWEESLEKEMATHSGILAWRMDREPWWAAVHGVAKTQTQLSGINHVVGFLQYFSSLDQLSVQIVQLS